MKYTLWAFFTLILNVSCAQSGSIPINQLGEKQLENGILVDVRTPDEFQQGHLEEALNINLFDPTFEAQFSQMDKQKTIYVYCKIGGRSAKAQERLLDMGFKNVVNLEGGYDAYSPKK